MKINVDMNQLIQNASYITQQAAEYEAAYRNVYELLEQLHSVWQGKDYNAFASQLNDFRRDFDMMKRVLDEYARYLRESASVYSRLQEECAAMAGRL